MKIGLGLYFDYHPSDAPSQRFDEVVAQVRAARRARFDLIAVPHHFSRGSSQWFPPLLVAAAIAPETGEMRVASCVFLLPMTHPVDVAEQVAMLDAIYKGRFVFGVGLGWRPEEFAAFGLERADRAGRFEEGLALIRRLWTEDKVNYFGRYFKADGVSLTLKPFQRPHPAIWIGGNISGSAIRRAAALGDAWVISSHPDLSTIQQHLGIYKEELDRLGKAWPLEFPVIRCFWIARDRSIAQKEIEDRLPRIGRGRPLEIGSDDGRLIIGSPDDCLDQIARLRRTVPASCLILEMPWMRMPIERTLEAIELVGNRIIPATASL